MAVKCENTKRLTAGIDLKKSCRFCLTIPVTTQTENLISNVDIPKMYKSLTGLEVRKKQKIICDLLIEKCSELILVLLFDFQFYATTNVYPITICTACSLKLKNAFEFREHLFKMNNHWNQLLKNYPNYPNETVAAQKQLPESDPIIIIQPKVETIIVQETNEHSDIEMIEEYVDEEYLDDDGNDDDEKDHVNGDEKDDVNDDETEDNGEDRGTESSEDDKFIQDVEDFVRTVKPTKPTKLKKIQVQKPIGKLLSAKSARTIAADTERLNFRSTSCPHSSQKLKKDNKWWRLMHDCNYCPAKDFLTVEAINKHLKLEHADLVKVTCDICNKNYSEVRIAKLFE